MFPHREGGAEPWGRPEESEDKHPEAADSRVVSVGERMEPVRVGAEQGQRWVFGRLGGQLGRKLDGVGLGVWVMRAPGKEIWGLSRKG